MTSKRTSYDQSIKPGALIAVLLLLLIVALFLTPEFREVFPWLVVFAAMGLPFIIAFLVALSGTIYILRRTVKSIRQTAAEGSANAYSPIESSLNLISVTLNVAGWIMLVSFILKLPGSSRGLGQNGLLVLGSIALVASIIVNVLGRTIAGMVYHPERRRVAIIGVAVIACVMTLYFSMVAIMRHNDYLRLEAVRDTELQLVESIGQSLGGITVSREEDYCSVEESAQTRTSQTRCSIATIFEPTKQEPLTNVGGRFMSEGKTLGLLVQRAGFDLDPLYQVIGHQGVLCELRHHNWYGQYDAARVPFSDTDGAALGVVCSGWTLAAYYPMVDTCPENSICSSSD